MKRYILFLLVVMASMWFSIQAKSTMELLINKDWHEFDVKIMDIRKDCYYRFTGTQRIIVGNSQNGEQKARVQKYYLSNKIEEFFDTTQVGKNKNGNYIIIQSSRNKSICYKIIKTSEDVIQIEDVLNPRIKRNFIAELIEEDNDIDKKGDVITTQELLEGKTWFLLDAETRQRTKEELFFKDNGTVVKCILPNNRKSGIPSWVLSEYYFSDTIVTKFDRKNVGSRKNGIYLVLNETELETNEWQTITYDIATLSDNKLVLEQVYPYGEIKVYENNNINGLERKVKSKPQQIHLIENIWYNIDTLSWQRNGYTEYFDKTHVTRCFKARTDDRSIQNKKIYEYYMSNQPETVFDKKWKNRNLEGDYLIVNEPNGNGGWHAVSYKIYLLNNSNFVIEPCNKANGNIMIFERDRKEKKQDFNEVKDSVLVGSTLDFLSGKQWRAIKADYKYYYKRRSPECVYFNAYKRITPEFKATEGGYSTELLEWNCYIGTYDDHNFSYGNLQKGNENGKYLNIGRVDKNGIKKSLPFKILYLSENLLIYEEIPEIKLDSNGFPIFETGPPPLIRRFTFITK